MMVSIQLFLSTVLAVVWSRLMSVSAAMPLQTWKKVDNIMLLPYSADPNISCGFSWVTSPLLMHEGHLSAAHHPCSALRKPSRWYYSLVIQWEPCTVLWSTIRQSSPVVPVGTLRAVSVSKRRISAVCKWFLTCRTHSLSYPDSIPSRSGLRWIL